MTVESFVRTIRARLADYRWRFAPAVYAKLARQDRRAVPTTIDISSEEIGECYTEEVTLTCQC